MRRYQRLAVRKYSCTLECLAYESLRLVKHPGKLNFNEFRPASQIQVFNAIFFSE
jgi:hypothetical protein